MQTQVNAAKADGDSQHWAAGKSAEEKRFGQQTPRRWGWGTPLKKRTATRIKFNVKQCKILPGFVNHIAMQNCARKNFFPIRWKRVMKNSV